MATQKVSHNQGLVGKRATVSQERLHQANMKPPREGGTKSRSNPIKSEGL